MNRSITFIAALLCAFVTVGSACAAPSDGLRFILEPQRGDGARLHASFREQRDGRNDSNWSSGFTPSELVGLEVSSFRAAGSRPLHFSVVREAGRLDCAGSGGNSFAAGNCRFTADAGFAQMLASRGIGQPTRDQAFALMAVNAHRAMLDAIAAARYPTPRMDDVIALSALGVDGRYIGDLARAGYRPQKISSLIEFKALNINAQWIGSFARAGYANLPADELVQLRALNITPDFIAGFQRIGYGNLPVNKLVELKALDITPEFVRSVTPANGAVPPLNQLAELKIFGRRR
ncbi:hypothetical protein [Sphingomonas flavescens]|uniref:hypothetical protein n=1 Tax=Sphingomonas flavescens TaxID=3132797 RepID=UPI002804F8A0|nr:hypothetical protein [Sphingomonas limnosediminicola]